MRWTIPNMLTTGRVLAAPALALCFVIFDRPLADWLAFILFAAASITDFFDGWVARRLNQVSEIGKMLDPIADKAMVIIALAVLVARQPKPIRIEGTTYIAWESTSLFILIPAALIILREVMVSGLREYLGDVKLPVTTLAKWKTSVQMVAIGVLLGAPLLSLVPGEHLSHAEYVQAAAERVEARIATDIGLVLLWISTILTAVTGWDYFRKGLAYIRSKEES